MKRLLQGLIWMQIRFPLWLCYFKETLPNQKPIFRFGVGDVCKQFWEKSVLSDRQQNTLIYVLGPANKPDPQDWTYRPGHTKFSHKSIYRFCLTNTTPKIYVPSGNWYQDTSSSWTCLYAQSIESHKSDKPEFYPGGLIRTHGTTG